MNGLRTIMLSIILSGLIAAVGNAYAAPARPNASVLSEKCGWECKNLKEDWNYLFHPDRINQVKPPQLKEPRDIGW